MPLPGRPTEPPWTETEIAKLRGLWAAGVSTKDIGTQMNRSKNSVVGKSHRLELDARPSPIIPKGTKSPKVKALSEHEQRRRAERQANLAAFREDKARRILEVAAAAAEREIRQAIEVAAKVAFAEKTKANAIILRPRTSASCLYPSGGFSAKVVFECAIPANDKSPYCGHHHKLCYTPASELYLKQEAA
jgi:GcrA cell cycle regulator